MSSSNVNVNDLVAAVAEDPNLTPTEKGTNICWTKDGVPTEPAARFDHHVARVHTEEAGLSRRLLRHPLFTVEELRVINGSNTVRYVEPLNFSRGQIAAVGGYIPIGTVKLGTSIRSRSGHAEVAPHNKSGSATMGLPPQNRLADPNRRVLPQPQPPVRQQLGAVDQATTEASPNTSGGEEGTPTFTDPLEF